MEQQNTEQQEQAWIDADLAALRRKQQDPCGECEAFDIMRRDRDAVARRDAEMFGTRFT